MPAKTKSNKGIKLSNKNDAMKKKMLLVIAVFSVIGVIFLIRSFAATTVYGVNIIDIVNANNPNWTVQGAKVVEIPDGKKTQKVVQLAKGSVLRYEFTMNPGYYKACYNLKPTSSDVDADIALGIIGQSGLSSAKKLNIANGSVALNQYSEHCVNLYEDGTGTTYKRFVAGVSINAGSWQVSTFAIRVDEDYASYASYGSYGTPTTGNYFRGFNMNTMYDTKDSQFTFSNVRDPNLPDPGTNSYSYEVKVTAGASIGYKGISGFPDGNYRTCFYGKPNTADAEGTMDVGRQLRGGQFSFKVGDQGSAVGNWSRICYPQDGVSFQTENGITANDPIYRTFKTTKGSWTLHSLEFFKQ